MDDELDRAYRDHRGYVRGCLRRAGLASDALDDAVHDVFTVLVRRRDDVDRRWSIRQYLAGIARHVAANHRRRAHRPDPGGLAQWGTIALSTPELQIDLRRELARLDAPQREAVLQSDREGRSAAEIARAHGVPLTTVQWRLRSAHQRLRALLERWREAAAAVLAVDLRRLFGARALQVGLTAALAVLAIPSRPTTVPPLASLVDASKQSQSPAPTGMRSRAPTQPPTPRADRKVATVRLGAPTIESQPPTPTVPRAATPPRVPRRRTTVRAPRFPADAIYYVMDDLHVPTRDAS